MVSQKVCSSTANGVSYSQRKKFNHVLVVREELRIENA